MSLFSERYGKVKLDPGLIAIEFGTTQEELIRAAGSSSQRRLREMLDVLDRVAPRFGAPVIAYAWYCSEPLSGFSNLSAMELVARGRAQDVLDYIDAVDAGGFA